tara:strand:- start:184 stop:936 length:753 start_codon:yes stop_codon:yes gene_type:complete
MLNKRIIPVLLLEDKSLIKTINFKNKIYIGDPLNTLKIFNEKFVDELIILDIKQNKLQSDLDFNFLGDLFSECFSPVTYGGGITNTHEADKILKLGAEKICLNTAVIKDKKIIKDFATNFGSQSIVVSVDVKKNFFNEYLIYNNQENKFEKKIKLDEYLHQLQDLGAGEILINSIDKDGNMKGMDLNLINKTKDIVKIPVIYCGGIGKFDDIKIAFQNDIAGVAGGSFFVFYGPKKAVLISYPSEEIRYL